MDPIPSFFIVFRVVPLFEDKELKDDLEEASPHAKHSFSVEILKKTEEQRLRWKKMKGKMERFHSESH